MATLKKELKENKSKEIVEENTPKKEAKEYCALKLAMFLLVLKQLLSGLG